MRQLGWQATILTVLALAAAWGPVTVARADGDPVDLLRQLVEAINAADAHTAIALLTDDVVFAEDVCVALTAPRGRRAFVGTCEGTGAARAGIDSLVAEQVTLLLTSADASGDIVTGALEVRAPFLAEGAAFGLEVERLIFQFWVQVSGGKIAVISGNSDLTDPQTAAAIAVFEQREAEARATEARVAAGTMELIQRLVDAGFGPSAILRTEPTQPWIPFSGGGLLLIVAGGRAEVYEFASPTAVRAALDQLRGDEPAFQPPANVTIWGSGSLIVILLDAPDSLAAEEALGSVLGGPAIATIVGLNSPPAALPTTGSGGLADDPRPGGTSPWLLALASASAFAILLGGLRVRFSR